MFVVPMFLFFHPLHFQVLEKLMYGYDPKVKTDEGILRLCKEIKDKWDGTMTPPNQYGLNDAWNKIKKAEVRK